jgi:hypothetical protein
MRSFVIRGAEGTTEDGLTEGVSELEYLERREKMKE